MAISSKDAFDTALANALRLPFGCPSFTTVSGGFYDVGRASSIGLGGQMGNAQIAIPAANTAGGTLHSAGQTGFPTLPGLTAGQQLYITCSQLNMGSAGQIWLYDRIWSCSGFNGTLTTAQAITGFPALTRGDLTGLGLEIWIECYTATGGTAGNITVQYTNSDGTAGRNTISQAHIASMPANRMYQVFLQAGDLGVRSIQSITMSASTGTAGNFGVTLMRRVGHMRCVVAGIGETMDYAQMGMPTIDSAAALLGVAQVNTTSSGIVMGHLDIAAA